MKFKDEVLHRLGSIDTTLAKQHESLKDHIRRTEILEKAVSPSRIISLIAAMAAIIESLHWIMK